jgi:hypothetical protein
MNTRLARWRRLGPILTVALVATLIVSGVAIAIALNSARQASARPRLASVWQTLAAKPLHFTHMAPGATCVATAAQQSLSPDYGAALGAGPVYVVDSGANGVVTFIPPALFNTASTTGGQTALGGVKVRWQIAPSYQGAVLIRGAQLDGSNQIGFNGGLDQTHGNALGTEPILSQLRLMGGGATAPSWPTWVTLTRLAHPGCYAYQVDGASFSYTITFQAVSEAG